MKESVSGQALAGPVAVLYQVLAPPEIDGILKPKKEGGYADSGADIAFVLRRSGLSVVTPLGSPQERNDLDWVFPDDAAGIAAALAAGAQVLWANTILFSGHPIETIRGKCLIVGQRPELVQAYDDKWAANARIRASGCLVANSFLVAKQPGDGTLGLTELSNEDLAARGLTFPVVIKPVRGRGSQGVTKVRDLGHLVRTADDLLASRTRGDGGDFSTFGDQLIVEEYLEGDEVTVTVMPPGTYLQGGTEVHYQQHWTLPPVGRFNHEDGIAPYSGVVAIIDNSRVLSAEDARSPPMRALLVDCMTAGGAIEAVAPLRIDCRRGRDGRYRLFDVNMKPNMTGAGRTGREKQDSLVCLAARSIGWSYADLLQAMLRQAW